MRLCHSSILIFICLTCLGYPIRASTIEPKLTPTELAQASSTIPVTQSVLIPGSQGTDVQELQTQLKDLGYYNGVVDGLYQGETQNAVVQFQKAQNLGRIDGTADMATRRSLRTAWTARNQLANGSATNQPQSHQQSFLWWSLLGLGILGSIGAIVFLLKWLHQNQQELESANKEFKALSPSEDESVNSQSSAGEKIPDSQENTAVVTNSQTTQTSNTAAFVSLESTSRLAKVNIVDELIQDLRSHDSKKRRKAIWDLGQQGDSKAIQPLVDLMMDSDSQQRSLILAALAEISSRALKPMNRALAISLQDESPQVRQNAIRDLTRVYDMMTQMSQMLVHATEDPDIDVQITAKYALSQMNRIRNLPNQRSLPEDNDKDQEAEDL
ncbi:HEAT repeat domain-containing protein [Nostoc sp. CCY0012]|uniref:HEAT repeat domain-containing protein n=1 Tax=Nostoc sp. CCY0012 TaxID=1056123 RepID=UPI0039C70A1D